MSAGSAKAKYAGETKTSDKGSAAGDYAKRFPGVKPRNPVYRSLLKKPKKGLEKTHVRKVTEAIIFGGEKHSGIGTPYRNTSTSGDPSAGRATKYGVAWDSGVTCRICKVEFRFPFKTRHHCRFCGRAVCKKCSRYRLPTPENHKKRACKKCYKQINSLSDSEDEKPVYNENEAGAKRPMLDLHLSCQNFSAKMTSHIKVSLKTGGDSSDLKDLGVTKRVKMSTAPVFSKPIRCEFAFEAKQTVRFEIFVGPADKVQLLGIAQIVLANLLANEKKKLVVPIKVASGDDATASNYVGELIASAGKIGAGENDEIHFDFSAKGLPKFDGLFGKADPYYEIIRKVSGEEKLIYRSVVVPKTLEPTWPPLVISKQLICDNNEDEELTIKVFDADPDDKSELIGIVQRADDTQRMTVRSLLEQCGSKTVSDDNISELGDLTKADRPESYKFIIKHPPTTSKYQRTNYTNSGIFMMKEFSLVKRNSFMQYVFGGLQLSLSIAIDFTESNGQPDKESSFHYIDQTGAKLNPYETTIKALADVLQYYDEDGKIPVYGFGADLRVNDKTDGSEWSKTNYCFPLNPKDVEVDGADGVLEAYRNVVNSKNIRFNGPSFFSDSISHLADQVEKHKCTQEDQHYHVLLILTDGVISDLNCTIKEVVRSSYLPISIIIVGVGKADFRKMELLDADNDVLIDKFGNEALRDIVQFVPLLALDGQEEKLGKVTLAELPAQVVDYMEAAKITPNWTDDIAGPPSKVLGAAVDPLMPPNPELHVV